jgi:hyperosmotically inducible periplasmic protein
VWHADFWPIGVQGSWQHAGMRAKTSIIASFLSVTLLAGCVSAGQISVGEYLDDSSLTLKVRSKLVDDTLLAPLLIEVDTIAGVVQLKGQAQTPAQRQHAESVARTIPGVKAVRNLIVVKPGVQASEPRMSSDAS